MNPDRLLAGNAAESSRPAGETWPERHQAAGDRHRWHHAVLLLAFTEQIQTDVLAGLQAPWPLQTAEERSRNGVEAGAWAGAAGQVWGEFSHHPQR